MLIVIHIGEHNLSKEFRKLFRDGFPEDWQEKLVSVPLTGPVEESPNKGSSKTEKETSEAGDGKKGRQKGRGKKGEAEQEKDDEGTDSDNEEDEDEEMFLHKLPEDMSDKQIRLVLKQKGLSTNGTRNQLNQRLRRRLASEKKKREKEEQKAKKEAKEIEKREADVATDGEEGGEKNAELEESIEGKDGEEGGEVHDETAAPDTSASLLDESAEKDKQDEGTVGQQQEEGQEAKETDGSVEEATKESGGDLESLEPLYDTSSEFFDLGGHDLEEEEESNGKMREGDKTNNNSIQKPTYPTL